jgi:hypothetical protein
VGNAKEEYSMKFLTKQLLVIASLFVSFSSAYADYDPPKYPSGGLDLAVRLEHQKSPLKVELQTTLWGNEKALNDKVYADFLKLVVILERRGFEKFNGNLLDWEMAKQTGRPMCFYDHQARNPESENPSSETFITVNCLGKGVSYPVGKSFPNSAAGSYGNSVRVFLQALEKNGVPNKK